MSNKQNLQSQVKLTSLDGQQLTLQIKAEAHSAGFDLVGVAPAVSPSGYGKLTEWLQQGFAGEMQYLPRRKEAYEHPRYVLPSVRSIIALAINYNPDDRAAIPSEGQPVNPLQGQVARYARGQADYHDVLRQKLKSLTDTIHKIQPGCTTRGVVDTAPLLERDFARLAGLGWFGKNTMLINKRQGSWLLLAAILTDLELEYDSPHETSHCGTCTRCLDVCPTDAFVEPYVLDARKCIAYLTIELRGSIPNELRDGIGNWLFGCDDCQTVCPWNRKAPTGREPQLQPLEDLSPADAAAILSMTRAEFETRFNGTPLDRPGWEGLRRNAAIVLGNSGDHSAIAILKQFANEDSPMVRETIEWALKKLNGD